MLGSAQTRPSPGRQGSGYWYTVHRRVEFAHVYERGSGKNGRGGKYMIYSGTVNSVTIPVNRNTVLINHTHPGGTASPSKKDLKLMALIKQAGSPQRTSAIIPIGKETIKFTSKGKKIL